MSAFVPLSPSTRARWRELFVGQAERMQATLQAVRDELTDLPGELFRNGWFERGDGETYYALLRQLQPQRVVELGSGFATAFAARALAANGGGTLTCFDPEPTAPLPDTALHVRQRWQRADPAPLTALRAGDVLFLDSGRGAEEALRAQALFERLPGGVVVHLHDVAYPRAPLHPEENLMIPYFAFRAEDWEGVAALALLGHELGPAGLAELFPGLAEETGRPAGSVWLRKRGEA